MKASVWLWPVITTLLCAIQLVCTAPFSDYSDYNGIEEGIEKRMKPSLSIVNPLDVLRQRLLLEMARRQMRENERQVEKNREYLNAVGKRSVPEFLELLRQEPIDNNYNIRRIRTNDPRNYNGNDNYQMRYHYSLHKNGDTSK
ncbi:diuretic hormone 44 [Hermetia illucens]|nr:diuretic hormone 44 [Hermetia illucens]XP_037923427.1 diuretic hormone 44 [Hermetia illucens]